MNNSIDNRDNFMFQSLELSNANSNNFEPKFGYPNDYTNQMVVP